MRTTTTANVSCVHCGARVCGPKRSVVAVSREQFWQLTPGMPAEVVIDGKLEPVVRCPRCAGFTNLRGAVVTVTQRPHKHLCGCGCGTMVTALRDVEVVRYA